MQELKKPYEGGVEMVGDGIISTPSRAISPAHKKEAQVVYLSIPDIFQTALKNL